MTCIVHAGFLYSNHLSRLGQSQYNWPINKSEVCSNLEYTLFIKHDIEIMRLQISLLPVPIYVLNNTTDIDRYKEMIRYCLDEYTKYNVDCLNEVLLTTPVIINVTLLRGCPPGLTLNRDQNKCSCYAVLADNGFKCSVQNKAGLLKWNSTVWVNATFNNNHNTGIIYNNFCPLHYCEVSEKTINIGDDPSKQCMFFQ